MLFSPSNYKNDFRPVGISLVGARGSGPLSSCSTEVPDISTASDPLGGPELAALRQRNLQQVLGSQENGMFRFVAEAPKGR